MDTSTTKCWHCSGSIDANDAFCRYCGKGQGTSVPFRYTHAGIIMFSLLIGPLALPFIWKSPRIGKNWRVAYTLINLLITGIMISAVFGIYNDINRQMQETLKLLEGVGK